MTTREERWWPWWWQIREVLAAAVGVGIATAEAYRGTYNPVAMGFVALCFTLVGASWFGRWILGRYNGNGGRTR